MLSDDDLRLQLTPINAWGRHNLGLRPRVDGRAQDGQEFRRGKCYGTAQYYNRIKLTG